MWGKLHFLILTTLVVLVNSAWGFHLDDHERITVQAVNEFKACFPRFAQSLNVDWLVGADREEDTNLFTKQLFYSHFFNPYKKLELWWREDSSGRIEDLKPELMQCRQAGVDLSFDEISALGHAIHHFQDMAVPAHVVPVNHSMWDGFESYAFSGDIGSQWDCQDLTAVNDGDLETILSETAVLTLQVVREMAVEAVELGSVNTVQLHGKDFWLEDGGTGFGTYGLVGNHFGEVQFNYHDEIHEVSENFYREFKRQQMQLAVRATLRGLIWALRP